MSRSTDRRRAAAALATGSAVAAAGVIRSRDRRARMIAAAVMPMFPRSVVFMGDSRIQDGTRYWKNALSSDWKGLPIGSGFCGPAITADFTDGLLEFRASDRSLRWTASGDTAGGWAQITQAGWAQLESATANKHLRVGVKNLTGFPVSDQSVTVSGSSSMNFGWNAVGICNRAMNLLRWLCPSPVSLGIGGSTTADVIEQLAYCQAQASGLGWDIVMVSTNDVTASVAAATVTANLQAIYDARRALGRKLVIVENTARWGVNTSTPLTAGQIAIFDAVRAFNQTYAAQHDCVYVDSYLLTYDSGFSDRRPAAGMLRDTVHPTDNGCQIIAAELVRLLKRRTGPGRFRTSADSNTFANGLLNGTGGTLGTGASGQVATGWTVGRATGTDGTATCSVIDRTDGGAGKMQRIQCANTTAGWMEFTATASGVTLAALGLAVGDTVYYEIEYEVTSPVALQNIAAQAFFTGASPTTALTCNVETSNVFLAEAGTMRTPPAKIPAGTTNVRPTNYLKFGANGSADVKFGVCRIVKAA